PLLLHEPDRLAIRLLDAHVARAAAVHAVHARLDFLVRRSRIALQQRARRHDVARDADAALKRRLVHERLLHRGQAGGAGEPLDGPDFRPFTQRGELHTGGDRIAVHDHRARATGADAAAVLRAGQFQIFAQDVDEQTVGGFQGDFDRVAVDAKFYL